MKNTGRLLELDSLRGIAALLVVFYHFTTGFAIGDYVFKFGQTGIELFFLISGFVIFMTIEKTSSYKDFIWSRFVRLYPTYWICVTITTSAIICWQIAIKFPITFPRFGDYLANLTMFQYWLNINNIDGCYWTLTIELCFYAFILIVYLFKQLHKIETIGYFVVSICLINQAFPLTALTSFFPIVNFFPLFIAGIVFYKIKQDKINISRGLLLFLCLATELIEPVYYIMTTSQHSVIVVSYFGIFFLYAYGYLKFIVNSVTLFFGKISYSLYLSHQYINFFILIPFLTHSRYFHLNPNVVVFLIAFPFSTLLAFAINRYVEVPTMKYFKRKVA